MAQLLAGIKPTLGRYTSLVIITPNVDANWLESLFPLLWLDCVPTILLLDPEAFGSQAKADGMLDLLSQWGINRHLIGPDLLDRPEARPGRGGRFEWRFSPTGRAILVDQPRDVSWKGLA